MPRSFRPAATYLTGLIIALAVIGVGWLAWPGHQGVRADDLPAPTVMTIPPQTDPARIEGHEKCLDCHVQEVRAWMASKHATRAFDLLRTAPTSREYAERLGIRPTDIARKAVCINCHATPRLDLAGNPSVIGGVSCEACHNASGGEDGWLNRHAVYGPRGTRREEETAEHFSGRQTSCATSGQLRSENSYQLVKRCFACHVVSDEALAEAGHDHGDRFEVLEKMLGEVRHNFFLDRHQNAEAATLWTDPLHHATGRTAAGRKRVLFIVGQLVDLETSLRGLATATDENDFSDLMIERIQDAYAVLAEDLLDELQEAELPEIERAVELVEPVVEKLDDDGFDADDRQMYLDVAKDVAKIAEAFSSSDGRTLTEVDDLNLLPAGPFEGIYQPGRRAEPANVP